MDILPRNSQKKCGLYARVSSSEQVKGYSIEAQLDAGREHAARQNWEVVAEYVDAGLSGTSDDRPQFKRMIRDALSGQFEIIMVHSFDRFSRNLEDAVVYKSLLRRDGVQVVSVTEQVDDGPLGFIHEGIIDLFAAYYSINLSAKIRSGLARSIEAGRWPWAVPTGYKRENGWVRISEAGAGIQMAFNEFATGNYTLDTWADAAYRAGLRGPMDNKIRPGGWSRIFHNRFYIGRLTWNALDVEGVHEPLIDETTFNRVQVILREHDQFAQHRERGFYMLSGLLWSLDANSSMVGARARGRNDTYRYYRSRSKNTNGSTKHYVRANELEGQIETALSQLSISPRDIDGLDVDESLRLALRVANNNLASIYQWLDTDEQRRAFLRLVISKYGLKVSCYQIVEVEPKNPFCFRLDINRVEMAGVEPSLFYLVGVSV